MSNRIDKIAGELAAIIKNADAKSTEGYDTPGTVRRIEGDTAWVHIPGGVDETPVKLTIAAKEGDTVQLRVAGGSAWLVGNQSAPPTDDATANRAAAIATKAEATAESVEDTANTANLNAAAAIKRAAAAQKIADTTNQYFWFVGTAFSLTEDTEVEEGKTYYQRVGEKYIAVVPEGTEDPSEQGWYEQTASDTGAHITEVPQDEFTESPSGGNLLARSNGLAVRDGLTELATFTGEAINLYAPPELVHTLYGSVSPEAEEWKLSWTGAEEAFAEKVGNVMGTYVFTYTLSTNTWALAGQTVDITEYGITLYDDMEANATLTIVIDNNLTYSIDYDTNPGDYTYEIMPDTFAKAVNNQTGQHVFVWDNTAKKWSYGEDAVVIQDYGIYDANYEYESDVTLSVSLSITSLYAAIQLLQKGVKINSEKSYARVWIDASDGQILIGSCYENEDGQWTIDDGFILDGAGSGLSYMNAISKSHMQMWLGTEESGTTDEGDPIEHPVATLEMGGGESSEGDIEPPVTMKAFMNSMQFTSYDEDFDIQMSLDEYASDGSLDKQIYDALVALGWTDCIV